MGGPAELADGLDPVDPPAGIAHRLRVAREAAGITGDVGDRLDLARRQRRSLLARRLAARTGARVFDRAEDADEEELFHAWNAAQASRRPLLLVADRAPPAWTPRLPDLASRLAATPHVAIAEPDDAMFSALLGKLLSARGLLAPPDLAARDDGPLGLAAELGRVVGEGLVVAQAVDVGVERADRPEQVRGGDREPGRAQVGDGLRRVAERAAGIAGLLKRHAAGLVPSDATIVCTVTGHGLKDPGWALKTADGTEVVPTRVGVDAVDVARALGLES